jgi:hypothetical protein
VLVAQKGRTRARHLPPEIITDIVVDYSGWRENEKGRARLGTDIYGWVEVMNERSDGNRQWFGVVRIRWLVDRNYGMFGNLFGKVNYGEFLPIAEGRGLPADASDEVSYDAASYNPVDPSWLLWSEIMAINWEEEGQSDTLGGDRFGRQVRREDTITDGWSTLWDVMEVLADRYGDANVRLVVWFDQ